MATLEPLYDKPYVIVYGRDTCGWTTKYFNDLRDRGLDVFYENVDHPGVGDELHPRMKKAGLDTWRYYLPVIDVNAKMYIRPDYETIFTEYENVD